MKVDACLPLFGAQPTYRAITCPTCDPERKNPDILAGPDEGEGSGWMKYIVCNFHCKNCETELVDCGAIKAQEDANDD